MSALDGAAWLRTARYCLDQAVQESDQTTQEVLLRRAVSTAYYATFHALAVTCSGILTCQFPGQDEDQIRRAINHSDLKKLSQRIIRSGYFSASQDPRHPRPSAQLKAICAAFVSLHTSREEADYEITGTLAPLSAEEMLETAADCLDQWHILLASERESFAQALMIQMLGRRRASSD